MSLCDFEYYVVGQEPAVSVHLHFGILCLSGIRIMLVKIQLLVCMLVGIVESGLCVFGKLRLVGFLVVCKSS